MKTKHSITGCCLALLAAPLAIAGPGSADVTFEIVCTGHATAVSADGTVIAGNTQHDYEPFRWSEATGRVRLGRASVPVLGVSAGIPGISADGTRISSTILGADSTYITMGIWTEGQGWQECIPPVPPDGGLLDNAYGSAWGLSGDGQKLVGLYWRPGQPGGLAHACTWSESTGIVDLGSNGGDSRADGANYDGSVVAGWSADPVTGSWRPAAWVDGDLSILSPPDLIGEAWAVNPSGTIIVGTQFADTGIRTAAMWRWNGSAWDSTEFLGALPGTAPPNGTVVAHALSADGSVVVGYNSFYGDPFYTTGFIWSEATGIVDVEDFLADNGITVPPGFDIQSLTAITPDGTTIVGYGQDVADPYTARSFIIRIEDDSGVSHPLDGPACLRVMSNPVKGGATVGFSLTRSSEADLEVYDINGRLVRRLLSGPLSAGSHEVRWDGTDKEGSPVAPGLYLIRMNTDGGSEFCKIMLLP